MRKKTVLASLYVLSARALFSGGSLAAEEWRIGNFNLLADFVYMQRYHVKDEPLAVDSKHQTCEGGCSSNRVLDTKNLIAGYKPGMRISFSYLPDGKSAYELNGLYLWEMDNTATRKARGVLSVPFHRAYFAPGFSDVEEIEARYRSLFYTGELNYLRTFSASRHSFFTLTGIFGLRFANISEHFSLDASKRGRSSSYDISAKNDLMGLQVGFDFEIHPTRRFYWDLLIKAGVDLNRISSKVFLSDLNNKRALRNYTKEHVQGGTFAEAAAGAGCQLLDWLNVHVGYQMLFFGGLALAPDQIDYSSDRMSDSSRLTSFSVETNGYIVIHGIYAGIMFSF